MKIIIFNTLIYYIIISIIFESIYIAIGYNRFKKNKEQVYFFRLFFSAIKSHMLKFFHHIHIIYVVALFFFLMIAPILFPFSIISLVKKIIGYNNPKQQKKEEVDCGGGYTGGNVIIMDDENPINPDTVE